MATVINGDPSLALSKRFSTSAADEMSIARINQR